MPYSCSQCPKPAQVDTTDHGMLCFDCLRKFRGVVKKNVVFELVVTDGRKWPVMIAKEIK